MSAVSTSKKPENKTARFEFKAEPGWIDRVEETARAMGLDVSSYIRLCVSEKMVADRRRHSLDE